jgi:uncharacterized iron-regulated membrane protein
MRQPQTTWLRKAMFQVHLWSGMILGLYVVVVCVSGSALVYRNDIYTVFEDWDKSGTVYQSSPWIRAGYLTLRWLGDVHGRLLLGVHGMQVNAIGGYLTAIICFTGIVIWWPGISRWKRALIVTGGVGWKRLNFDLHSALGIWTFALLLMWGLTGGYFVYPQAFRAVINYFTPIDPPLPPRPTTAQSTSVVVASSNAAAANATSTKANLSVGAAASVQTKAAVRARPASQTAAVTPSGVPQTGVVTRSASQPSAARQAMAVTPAPAPFPRRRRRPLTKGGKILQWFSLLHYGNFAGWKTKALWTLLGLAPAFLFGTGMIMWWNRVLSPAMKRSRREWESAPASITPELEFERE